MGVIILIAIMAQAINQQQREALKAELERAGVSQRALAKRVGIAQPTVHIWLKFGIGLRPANVAKLIRQANILLGIANVRMTQNGQISSPVSPNCD